MNVFMPLISFITAIVVAVIIAVLAIKFKGARKVLLIVSVCSIVLAVITTPHSVEYSGENELIDKFAQNDWSDKEKVKNAGFEFNSDEVASLIYGDENGFGIYVDYSHDKYQLFYDQCPIVRENYRYFFSENDQLNWIYLPESCFVNFVIAIDDNITVSCISTSKNGDSNPIYKYMQNTKF